MDPEHVGHDIIAIGASAGGVGVLQTLMRELPADLPASVLVVLHVGASSHLAEILDASGPLRATQARSGELIERGRVYVAAPGAHLLVHDNHVLLRRGPRENLSRPAVDPLFRSAAASFGGRVVGVVLSGTLNDGTAGLRAIKRCGGLAVVQDPGDAAMPDMPTNALRNVDVDHVVEAAGLAELLVRLTHEPAGVTPDIPIDIRLEAAVAAQELGGMKLNDVLGSSSPFTCPECEGVLWEIEDGDLVRYRCHTGHAFTAEVMLSTQAREIDNTLGRLLRLHQERVALTRRIAARERRQRADLAQFFDARAREYEDDAEVVRQLLLSIEQAGIERGEPEGATLE